VFRWASIAFALLAALSTGGAIVTGHVIDRERDAEIAAVQSRHITKEQREQLIALLKPVEKAPVFFNPLMTSGEAIQFSDEIKDVLAAAGFEVADVLFGDESLLSLNRTGAFLWFRDRNNPPKHAKFIYEAFRRVGIPLFGDPQPDFPDPARLVIVVATHP
jgi:hypothetical protein